PFPAGIKAGPRRRGRAPAAGATSEATPRLCCSGSAVGPGEERQAGPDAGGSTAASATFGSGSEGPPPNGILPARLFQAAYFAGLGKTPHPKQNIAPNWFFCSVADREGVLRKGDRSFSPSWLPVTVHRSVALRWSTCPLAFGVERTG